MICQRISHPILTPNLLLHSFQRANGSNPDGSNIPTSRTAIKYKLKVVKMLVIVAVLFVLCWLPYFSLLMIQVMSQVAEKPAVWRCSRTTAKRGIETNPGWGEPNTSWEGPKPEDLPAVGGTGDDLRKV